MDAPASLRKPRRETGSTHSGAWRGNSRSSSSPKAFWSASSSKVRQYFGPLASASFLRTVSSSMLAGLTSLAEIRLGFESFLLDIRFHIVSTLSVAGGATGYVLLRAQVIFLPQSRTKHQLVSKRLLLPADHHFDRGLRSGLLILHVENFALGPQKLLRLAMAVQAPLHLQGVLFIHQRHFVHRAVATEAAHALVDVNAVIEVHKIGQVMHPRPLQRLAAGKAIAHRRQHGCVGPYLRMAVHAGLGGGIPAKLESS